MIIRCSHKVLHSPCATDDGRLHTGSGLLAQSLVRSLAAQGSMRAVEIVEVLPFLELGGEQLSVVVHDAVEEPVELFGVDPCDRSTLPLSRGVAGLM